MILVTGVSGHLGSRVFELLKSQGYPAIGIVNTNSSIVQADIKKLNLTDASAVVKFCQQYQVTECIHCASVMASACESLPIEMSVDINVLGTSNLLKWTWKKFVYVSTGSVFQDSSSTCTEETEPTPKNVYGLTKRLAEIDVIRHNGIVARVSWLYGPPITSTNLDPVRGPIPWLIGQFKKQSSVHVLGSDHCASFTYVDDVADALKCLLIANQLNNNIYHIGTGKNHSVKEIASMLAPLSKVSTITFDSGIMPWSRATRQRPPLSTNRIKNELGWTSQWTLEEGIKHYWKMFVNE